MDDVARVIDAPGPHDLVRAASTFVEVFRRRPLDAMTPDRTGRTVSGAEFFDALIGHNVRETTGLMTALVLLLDDEVTVARMRRELAGRAHHLPDQRGFNQVQLGQSPFGAKPAPPEGRYPKRSAWPSGMRGPGLS